MCSLLYAAHGADRRSLGAAHVSGGGSAAMGGGVSEAVAVLFTIGCRLPEQGGGNCCVRSVARHSVREHQHSCGSARGSRLVPKRRRARYSKAAAEEQTKRVINRPMTAKI